MSSIACGMVKFFTQLCPKSRSGGLCSFAEKTSGCLAIEQDRLVLQSHLSRRYSDGKDGVIDQDDDDLKMPGFAPTEEKERTLEEKKQKDLGEDMKRKNKPKDESPAKSD